MELVDLLILSLELHNLIEAFRSLAVKVILELFLLLDECFDLLLLGKDFIREWKAFSFSGFTFWISILDIMNDETAILADCEEVVVVVAETHSFDLFGVSLDFIYFVNFTLTFGVIRDLVDHN